MVRSEFGIAFRICAIVDCDGGDFILHHVWKINIVTGLGALFEFVLKDLTITIYSYVSRLGRLYSW
jgi:hypothetical protein